MYYTKVLSKLERTKDALAKKLDSIKSDVTNVNNSVTNLPTTLDSKFSALTSKVDGVKTDVAGVGGKVDTLGSTLGAKVDGVGNTLGGKVDELNAYNALTNIDYRFPDQLGSVLVKKFTKNKLNVNKVIALSEALPSGVQATQYTTLIDITAPCVFKFTQMSISASYSMGSMPQHKAKLFFKITFRGNEKEVVRFFALKRDTKGIVYPGGSASSGTTTLTFDLTNKNNLLEDKEYSKEPPPSTSDSGHYDFSYTVGLGANGGVPCVGGYKIEYYLVATNEFKSGAVNSATFSTYFENNYVLLGQ